MSIENKIEEEYHTQINKFIDYAMDYSKGYISELYNHGIIDSISVEQLQNMFASPDCFQEEIDDLIEYFYVSNAEVHQLFEMVEVLPTMNHKLESFTRDENSAKNFQKLNKHLKKIRHKRLTRDLMKQTSAMGNTVGLWLGRKSNPFPYVFDDTSFVYPIGRNYRGEWVCVMDLNWLKCRTDAEIELYYDVFKDIGIKKAYELYLKDPIKNRYFTLPYERTFCLSTGKLKRNQGQGTSWGTPGLFDVLHKKKLKDMEQALANKIINAVAILTVGTDKVEGRYTNALLPSKVKRTIHQGVKNALEKKELGGVSVVTIPDYAKLEFEKVNADGLGGDKFKTVNSDIKASYGISGAMTNGEGTNYAIAKLNLEIFYKRLAVMLEDIEDEVYAKLFNLMLPKSNEDEYYINYDKEMPLEKKERVAALKNLNDKGGSMQYYLEEVGIDYEEYLAQTTYEANVLKLQTEVFTPYATSYTTNGEYIETANGRPKQDDNDTDNENTIRARESGN